RLDVRSKAASARPDKPDPQTLVAPRRPGRSRRRKQTSRRRGSRRGRSAHPEEVATIDLLLFHVNNLPLLFEDSSDAPVPNHANTCPLAGERLEERRHPREREAMHPSSISGAAGGFHEARNSRAAPSTPRLLRSASPPHSTERLAV